MSRVRALAIALPLLAGCASDFSLSYRLPDPPAPVSAIAGIGEITIDWEPVPAAIEYRVYYASESGVTPENIPSKTNFAFVFDARPGEIFRLDTTLTWYFIVAATSERGAGEPSAEVAAKAIGVWPGGLGPSIDALVPLDGGGIGTATGFGTSVAFAGDLDDDGFGELAIGVPYTANGSVALHRGSEAGPSSQPSIVLEGTSSSSLFGRAVAAGDVTGDGIADLLVGAPAAGSLGQVTLHRGGGSATLAATPMWTVDGTTNSQLGAAVAFAGDVNGDGNTDAIVGAPAYSGSVTLSGAAYVFYGTGDSLETTSSWMATGTANGDRFGVSVSGAGDVNADGFADVVVGCDGFDVPMSDAGKFVLYLGGPNGLSLTSSMSLVGTNTNSRLGLSVAGGGDVDGDGYDDFFAGSPGHSAALPGQGSVTLAHGGPSGPSLFSLVFGPYNLAGLGQSVSAGDLNGDGHIDLLTGALGLADGFAGEGGAQVFIGGSAGLPATATWQWTAGVQYADGGTSVAIGADVNGDGLADVATAAPAYDTPTVDAAGHVSVFAGSPPEGPVVNAGSPFRAKAGKSARPKSPSFTAAAPSLGIRCTWSWGDGASPSEIFPCNAGNVDQEVRVYAVPGTYRVVLRVEDGFGLFGESGTLAIIE